MFDWYGSFSCVAFVLHSVSQKTLLCSTKNRKIDYTQLILVNASNVWYELLCLVNAYVRTHWYYNKSASSEYYRIETRSAVPMKKKKTSAVHITGYNILALDFCATCSDILINSHWYARSATHTPNMQPREVKVAHYRKVY